MSSEEENAAGDNEDVQVDEALGFLKDDEEFMEFRVEDWKPSDEDPDDCKIWDENWDTESIQDGDEFTTFLRDKLEEMGFKPTQTV